MAKPTYGWEDVQVDESSLLALHHLLNQTHPKLHGSIEDYYKWLGSQNLLTKITDQFQQRTGKTLVVDYRIE